MPTLTIDNQQVTVNEGVNIIEAAKEMGLHIPHFCYHPGLSTDGNCRMCMVELEGAPKPVIACKTLAKEGMNITTNSELIKKARQSVMEFLLINHPLDCPTCDQAGECKLQDYYMDYDVQASRFKEKKVQKRKMVDLGAGVMLDEERCVVCRRCVRFCKEVANKEELYVQERGHNSMVATFPGKELTNAYAGCTVDVCPVGALTSKDFRYKKRVWYLSKVDAICPGCSRGCNISIHHENGVVYRIKPRFNKEVNGYWMCDYGRYDYKWLNENRRLKPVVKEGGAFKEMSLEEAKDHLEKLIKEFAPYEVAFIASAMETNESIDEFILKAKKDHKQDFVYYSKNDPKEKYADDILINEDKNPNMMHVVKNGLRSVSEIPADVKAVVVQRDVCEKDLEIIKQKNLKVLALYATNITQLDELAKIIIPIPTYFEKPGCFTNFEGKVQG